MSEIHMEKKPMRGRLGGHAVSHRLTDDELQGLRSATEYKAMRIFSAVLDEALARGRDLAIAREEIERLRRGLCKAAPCDSNDVPITQADWDAERAAHAETRGRLAEAQRIADRYAQQEREDETVEPAARLLAHWRMLAKVSGEEGER